MAADSAPLNHQLLLSISRLASEFGMARATVADRLQRLGIQPAGTRGGYPTYRVRDACKAILVGAGEGFQGIDPSTLAPTDRRAYWQAENERLRFEAETGQLILADEVRFEMSSLAKIVTRSLEVLADNVERDLRCGPDVVEYLHKKVYELRLEIANRLRDEDADESQVRA